MALAVVAASVALYVFWPGGREPTGLPVVAFSGPTMGTRYEVIVVCHPTDFDRRAVAADIDAVLDRVDRLMSTYRADSELSRFNAAPSTDWWPVSSETATVVDAALAVSRATGGAYDVTVAPLVRLWSFGPNAAPRHVPDEAEIAAVRTYCGYQRLDVRLTPPALRKGDARLSVDLSSIAPGYAAERIAAAMDARGVARYLVDVGGELQARGRNGQGLAWQVGIDDPSNDGAAPQRVVELSDRALATSGDYRSFFERDGVRYSHLIDPRSARPISGRLAAVTVVARSAMLADAWATALLILGPEAGYETASRQGLAARFLIRDENSYRERLTPAFPVEASAPTSQITTGGVAAPR
jgi:thiamine biosynthesis lipoprotein